MTRNNRWPLAIAAGAFTTAFIGGAALAGVQLPARDAAVAATVPTVAVADAVVSRDSSKNKLKAILDGLVAKHTITQAQADAILQAVKDAEPAPKPKAAHVPHVMSFIGDLAKAASQYLGMDQKALLAQLREGKSIADIANGLSAQNKSALGLIDLLTKTANDKLDQAVAAKSLTADQATALKPRIAAEITSFVNRSFKKPVLPRPLTPVKPIPSPKS